MYGNPLRFTDPLGLDGGIDDCGFGVPCDSYPPPSQKDSCDCITYDLTEGPLTREQADRKNTWNGHRNNILSLLAGGLSTAVLTRFGVPVSASGTVGTGSGFAASSALTENTQAYHQGDIVTITVEVCFDTETDSGVQTRQKKIEVTNAHTGETRTFFDAP